MSVMWWIVVLCLLMSCSVFVLFVWLWGIEVVMVYLSMLVRVVCCSAVSVGVVGEVGWVLVMLFFGLFYG